MEKIRMYRVGMNGWQKTCKSIDEALACRPQFEFIDDRLRKQYPLEEIKENAPEETQEGDQFDYTKLSEKEKKQYLEKVAREYGVEIDKRKKLEDLETIVDGLIGE
jgi:hypothetical protein